MTKEQAMKIMNEWNKCEELVIRENTDYDKTIYIQRKEAIETVLNMLKEKDELYHKALGDLVKADRENIKKDKIIDLMAEDWFFKEGYKLQIYKQRNRTDDRIFRKKRKYNQNV